MADTVGYATLPIIPSFQGTGSAIASGISAPMATAGSNAGAGFTAGFKRAFVPAAIIGGVVGSFKGLYEVGEVIDDVTDTIRVGTGAQGAALNGLVANARAVGGLVPATLTDIGSAVADVNTRLGYSGPLLEGFTARLLEVGRMQDAPVSVNDLSAAINGFNVPAEQANETLDRLFQISQATGVPVAQLTSSLSTQGAVLGQLGFSLTDSAALLGTLDKAGLNANAVMRSLSAGIVRLAKDGEAPADAFNRVTAEIQGYIDSGNDAAALDLAGQVFGTRGAAQFVGALQAGVLNIGDLQAAVGATGDTILGVSAETRDFSENVQILRNNLIDRLAPAGESVFGLFNTLFGRFVDFVVGLPPLGEIFAPVLDTLGPIVSAVGDALAPAFAAVWQAIGPLIPQLLELWVTASPVMLIFQAIAPLLPQLAALFSQLVGVVAEFAGQVLPILIPIITQVAGIFGQMLATILPIVLDLITQLVPIFIRLAEAIFPVVLQVLGLIEPLLQLIQPLLDLLGPILGPLVDLFVMLIDIAITPLINALQLILPPILDVVGGIVESLMPVISALAEILGGLIDFIVGVFTGDWERAWNGIISIFSGIWNGIVGVVKGVLNTVIDVINGIIGGINDVLAPISDATGGAINLKIPKIPRLGIGADVYPRGGGTLAILAEQGRAETVTDLGVTNRALAATTALAESALAGLGTGDVSVAVYLDGELLRPVAVKVYREQDENDGDAVKRRKRPTP